VDPVFGAPGQHSSLELLCAVYGYAVQIWADFSGYTDIAIGVALLLGFRFPQNFNSPYAATSLQDFWRRWHMTLSRWLRDYVYIPLGGNRGGRLMTYRNLMLTMLVGGLWHGAGWTFVAWGALWGAGLVAERAWHDRRAARGVQPSTPTAAGLMWRRLATFNFACLGWIFFRSDSFGTATDVITGLFTRWDESAPLVTSGVLAAIAIGIAWQYVPERFVERLMSSFSGLRLAFQASILAVTLTVVAAMGPQGVAPFIYFRF
jgi:D-alanyl-lipoteichoic acid acyltransferase DltB (MBOAT superfamily)